MQAGRKRKIPQQLHDVAEISFKSVEDARELMKTIVDTCPTYQAKLKHLAAMTKEDFDDSAEKLLLQIEEQNVDSGYIGCYRVVLSCCQRFYDKLITCEKLTFNEGEVEGIEDRCTAQLIAAVVIRAQLLHGF